MGLQCPLPCKIKEENDSDKSLSNSFRSESSYNSYSLSSQLSLPSIPSLTSSSSSQLPIDQPSNTNHKCLAILKGHSSYVFSLALCGKNLYSGSSNSEIRVWSQDPSSQKNVTNTSHETLICNKKKNMVNNVVAEGYSAVKCMVVSGDKLFTAHQDHKIRVWRVNSDVPNSKLKCIAALPTVNDRCMKLFSPKNYVKVRRDKKSTWVNHVDTVSSLAISKDGSLLYSGSWDRTFKVWRTSDFKCLESVYNAHDDAINSIVLSTDGRVYTGSADRRIKVWKNPKSGNKKHVLMATLEKHKSAINALALSNDGSVLYSGACDRSIIVWENDGENGEMVITGALRGHKKAILCLTVVFDLVFSGSADKTVRVWRRGVGKSYSCLGVFEGHMKPVKCLIADLDRFCSKNDDDFSVSGKNFLIHSGSLDCEIRIWRITV